MIRKQSLTEHLNRLNEGRCPIHGLFMSQVDSWYYPEDREPYTIVGCGRRDCEAQKKTSTSDLPPTVVLVAKKSGKNIAPGETVTLQVRNADGTLSEAFTYTRPK